MKKKFWSSIENRHAGHINQRNDDKKGFHVYIYLTVYG